MDKKFKAKKLQDRRTAYKVVSVTIENHLTMLAKNFKRYFLVDNNLVARYEWVRVPFKNTPEGLLTAEEEIFIHYTVSAK